jgi:hypothetical protein
VVSELVTNSLAGTAGPVAVRLLCAGGRLRIGVRDSSPEPPRASPAGLDAESGRGLWLVGACADDWGHDGAVTGGLPGVDGKEVWAEWRAPCP